jgi:hypothetical protein
MHIRPYRVLSIEDGREEEVKFFMPPADGAGSLTAFESVMLLKLVRAINPNFIFEFGTFDGRTTRLVLEDLPDNGDKSPRIYTLDLPDTDGIVFQGDDKLLAEKAVLSSRKYNQSEKKGMVKQILQDSMTFDPTPYKGKFDFSFRNSHVIWKTWRAALSFTTSKARCWFSTCRAPKWAMNDHAVD